MARRRAPAPPDQFEDRNLESHARWALKLLYLAGADTGLYGPLEGCKTGAEMYEAARLAYEYHSLEYPPLGTGPHYER